MYYILYGFLYLVSLLPFSILYFLSSGLAFLLQHVIHYRKKIIHSNLKNAFPEKSESEIRKLMNEFYVNLTDSAVETIKLISLSKKKILLRNKVDVSEINKYIAAGRNVQFNVGHLFGWESLNLAMAAQINIPLIGIYMRINNEAVNRLFLKFRSRTGAVLLSAAEMPKKFPEMNLKRYAPGFIADQNPPNEKSAYWLNYFNRPAPFLTGPEKFAQRNDMVVFFLPVHKIKRGYYEFSPLLITENAKAMEPGALTRKYRDLMEAEIKKDPSAYLWSHRRWKTPWNISFKRKWIDVAEMPA